MSCLFLFRNNDGCDSTRRFGSLPPRTIAVYLSCFSKEPCVPGVRISFPCLLHLSKFPLCCKPFNELGADFFGVKKIARSSSVSREAKVVQSYGDFLTRQNFCQTFNKLLHPDRCPASTRLGRFPFAGAKVRRLFGTHQIFLLFFSRKNGFFSKFRVTP